MGNCSFLFVVLLALLPLAFAQGLNCTDLCNVKTQYCNSTQLHFTPLGVCGDGSTCNDVCIGLGACKTFGYNIRDVCAPQPPSLVQVAVYDPLAFNIGMPSPLCRAMPTRDYILNALTGGTFNASGTANYCNTVTIENDAMAVNVLCANSDISTIQNYVGYQTLETNYPDGLHTEAGNIVSIDILFGQSVNVSAIRFDCLDYLMNLQLSVYTVDAVTVRIDDLAAQLQLLPRLRKLVLFNVNIGSTLPTNLANTLYLDYLIDYQISQSVDPIVDYIHNATNYLVLISATSFNFTGVGNTLEPNLKLFVVGSSDNAQIVAPVDIASINWDNYPNLHTVGVYFNGPIGLYGIVPSIFANYSDCTVIVPQLCTNDETVSAHCQTPMCSLSVTAQFNPLAFNPTMSTQECTALPNRDYILNAFTGNTFTGEGTSNYCNGSFFENDQVIMHVLCGDSPTAQIENILGDPTFYTDYVDNQINTEPNNIIALVVTFIGQVNSSAIRFDCLDYLMVLELNSDQGSNLTIANLAEQLQLLPRLRKISLTNINLDTVYPVLQSSKLFFDYLLEYSPSINTITYPLINYVQNSTLIIGFIDSNSYNFTGLGDVPNNLEFLGLISAMDAQVYAPVDIASINWENMPNLPMNGIYFGGAVGLYGYVPAIFATPGHCFIDVPQLCTIYQNVSASCGVPLCSLARVAEFDPLAFNPNMTTDQCRSQSGRDYILNALTGGVFGDIGTDAYCQSFVINNFVMTVQVFCASQSLYFINEVGVQDPSLLIDYPDGLNTSANNIAALRIFMSSDVNASAIRFDCLDYLLDLEIYSSPSIVANFENLAEQLVLLPRLRKIFLVDIEVSTILPLILNGHLFQDFFYNPYQIEIVYPISDYLTQNVTTITLVQAGSFNWTGVGQQLNLNLVNFVIFSPTNAVVSNPVDISSINWSNYPNITSIQIHGAVGLIGIVPSIFATFASCSINVPGLCAFDPNVSGQCGVSMCSLVTAAQFDPLFLQPNMTTDQCRALPTRSYILNELTGGLVTNAGSDDYCSQTNWYTDNCVMVLSVQCATIPVANLYYDFSVNQTNYPSTYIDTPPQNVFGISITLYQNFTGKAIRFDCFDYLFRLYIAGQGEQSGYTEFIEGLYTQLPLLPRLSILVLTDIETDSPTFWSNLTQSLVIDYNNEEQTTTGFLPLSDYTRNVTKRLSMFSKTSPFNFTGFGLVPNVIHALQLGTALSIPPIGFIDINSIDWATNFPELFTSMSMVWFEGNMGLVGVVPDVFAGVTFSCIITSPDLCSYNPTIQSQCGTQACPDTLHDAALIDPLFLNPSMSTEQCRQLNTRAYILDQLTGGQIVTPGSGEICSQHSWSTDYVEYMTIACANTPISMLNYDYYLYNLQYYSTYLPTTPNNVVYLVISMNAAFNSTAVRFDCLDYLVYLYISDNVEAPGSGDIENLSIQILLLPRLQTLVLLNVYAGPEFYSNFTSKLLRDVQIDDNYNTYETFEPVQLFLESSTQYLYLYTQGQFNFTGFGATQSNITLLYLSSTSTATLSTTTDIASINWANFPNLLQFGTIELIGSIGLSGVVPDIFLSIPGCYINGPQLCSANPSVVSHCNVSGC